MTPQRHDTRVASLPHWPAGTRLHAGVLTALALAAMGLWLGDERAVFGWFNHPGLLPGIVWQGLSVLGLGAAALILINLLAWPARPQMLAAVWLSLFTAGLPIHLLKRVVERARPAAVLPPEAIEVLGRPLLTGALPSGHAGTAMAVLAVVWLARPVAGRAPWPQLGALVFALGVMASRMAVGAHWPWDVLTGAALGWLGGAAAVWLANRCGFTAWCAVPRHAPVLHALLLLAGLALAFDRLDYPDAQAVQVVLATVAVAVALWRLGRWLQQRQRSAA